MKRSPIIRLLYEVLATYGVLCRYIIIYIPPFNLAYYLLTHSTNVWITKLLVQWRNNKTLLVCRLVGLFQKEDLGKKNESVALHTRYSGTESGHYSRGISAVDVQGGIDKNGLREVVLYGGPTLTSRPPTKVVAAAAANDSKSTPLAMIIELCEVWGE
jgi:hypothetical protein